MVNLWTEEFKYCNESKHHAKLSWGQVHWQFDWKTVADGVLKTNGDETGLVVKFKVMNKYNFYEKTGLS